MKQTGFRINAVTITANNCIIYYLVNTGGLTFPRLTWPDTCRGTRARCWRWPARTARPPRRWASSPSPAGPAPRRPSRTCRWAWHRVGGAALCWLAPRHPTTDTHPPRSPPSDNCPSPFSRYINRKLTFNFSNLPKPHARYLKSIHESFYVIFDFEFNSDDITMKNFQQFTKNTFWRL